MALDFLEWFALIEKKCKLGRGKRLKSQEITESISHNLFTSGFASTNPETRPVPFLQQNSPPLLFYPVHKNYALLIINFAQPHFDDFAVAGLHHATRVLRFDGHFAVAAVDQHTQ